MDENEILKIGWKQYNMEISIQLQNNINAI